MARFRHFFKYAPLPQHFEDNCISLSFDFICCLSNLDQQKFGWLSFSLSRIILKKPLWGHPNPPFVQEGLLKVWAIIIDNSIRTGWLISGTHLLKIDRFRVKKNLHPTFFSSQTLYCRKFQITKGNYAPSGTFHSNQIQLFIFSLRAVLFG